MARRKNDLLQERISISLPIASTNATKTTKLWKAPRKCVVTDVRYLNETGLAENATNAFNAKLVKTGGTTVATLFDTDSDLVPDTGASLPANTFVTGALASNSSGARVLAAGDELSFVATLTGTATLPAGQIQIELLYL